MFKASISRTSFRAVQHNAIRNGSNVPLRNAHTNANGRRTNDNSLTMKVVLGVAAGVAAYHGLKGSGIRVAHAETASVRATEEKRGELSSQHIQVMRSWESPGVYVWGSNSGNVAAPDSSESYVKTPRRLSFFDGKALRDLKLERNLGVAIDDRGDLLQWGTAYSKDVKEPVYTLKGLDLKRVELSGDRILAMSRGGSVYSLPVSQLEQESQDGQGKNNGWIPFWSGSSQISYRKVSVPLGWTERVLDIKSGRSHCIILTSSGRVFSLATNEEAFPSRGELGISTYAWNSRPQNSPDHCHEITALRGFKIAQIATGDHHSVVLDELGRVFAFGDNSSGQCGFDFDAESSIFPLPVLVPIERTYSGSGVSPRVTSIAAGGLNTFFTVDATANTTPDPDGRLRVGKVSADVLACGQGIYGSLGNGRWTHVQGQPVKVKSLSGLYEYSESSKSVVPIRVAALSVGATHSAAVLDNITHVDAKNSMNENDTNWGADVLWWGGNEFYQIGTGKRNNLPNPTYIPPLDPEAEEVRENREEHRFQITPKKTIKIAGRNMSVMQKIECGKGISAIYSAV